MKTFQTPDVCVLTDLLSWISEGICRTGPYNSHEPQLVFHAEMCHGVDKKPSTILTVLNKNNEVLGIIAPLHNENTGAVEGFVMNRKTELGYFVERTSGLYEYMADYAVNFYLVDPDVIKREFDERNQNSIDRLTITKPKEDGPAKPQVYEVELKDFYDVMRADMGENKNDLGKVLGIYKLKSVNTLKDLHFECFVAGNEYGNWVQCLVIEQRGKFPRIYGSFRMNDTYVVIESRFFKGAIETALDLGLVDVIDKFMVKPHANYGTK